MLIAESSSLVKLVLGSRRDKAQQLADALLGLVSGLVTGQRNGALLGDPSHQGVPGLLVNLPCAHDLEAALHQGVRCVPAAIPAGVADLIPSMSFITQLSMPMRAPRRRTMATDLCAAWRYAPGPNVDTNLPAQPIPSIIPTIVKQTTPGA